MRASSGPGQLQIPSCTFSLDQQSPRAGQSVQKYLTIPFTYFSSLWFGQNKPSQFLIPVFASPAAFLGVPQGPSRASPCSPRALWLRTKAERRGVLQGHGAWCSCIMWGTSRRANLMTCRGKLEGKICGCSLSARDSKRSPQGASGCTRSVY